jgi:hypothetical protein
VLTTDKYWIFFALSKGKKQKSLWHRHPKETYFVLVAATKILSVKVGTFIYQAQLPCQPTCPAGKKQKKFMA